MVDEIFRVVEEYAAAEADYTNCKLVSERAAQDLDRTRLRLEEIGKTLKTRVGSNIPRKYFILKDGRILIIDLQTGIKIIEPEHA